LSEPHDLEDIARRARDLVDACDAVNQTAMFLNRGLSPRTVKALMDHGVDAPERLLSMSEPELRRITGIWDASVKEIQAYKAAFGPGGKWPGGSVRPMLAKRL
jgi:hypothetical protein